MSTLGHKKVYALCAKLSKRVLRQLTRERIPQAEQIAIASAESSSAQMVLDEWPNPFILSS